MASSVGPLEVARKLGKNSYKLLPDTTPICFKHNFNMVSFKRRFPVNVRQEHYSFSDATRIRWSNTQEETNLYKDKVHSVYNLHCIYSYRILWYLSSP